MVLALVSGKKIFWVSEKLPFPDFLGRFASWQAASGISECSVAASGIGALIHLGLADDVALADEPAGLQHSSLHSALILSRSIGVNQIFETIIDSA